jgi:hypothetical protein
VYIAFGSHNDIGPYHGWLLGYDAGTLQQVMVFCATPDGAAGGIWLSNGGAAADADGNIYVITGNGTFSADTGGRDYGNSFVKISPAGTVLDYFTPFDQLTLSENDRDLGATGPLLLPDQPGGRPHLIVAAGKNGTIYVVDRDDMGGYNPVDNSQIVQSMPAYFASTFSAPTYFNGYVYFSPPGGRVETFAVANGMLSTTGIRSQQSYSFPGGSLAISASGTSNGILWAVQRNGSTSPAVLRAYNALNLGQELYNSSASGTRDQLDPAAKFSVPLVADGKVFVATTGTLTVFGLLPQ